MSSYETQAPNATSPQQERLPILEAVPKSIPRYANGILYGLGGFTLLCFMLLAASGIYMVALGSGHPGFVSGHPELASFSHFVRAVHYWSAQFFMLFMFLHLLRVFFTGAYRRPREVTWMIGVLMMVMAIITGLLGYISRADWSAQWHAVSAKDLFNAAHAGTLLNVLDYPLVFGLHVAVSPLIMIGLMAVHFVLIRLHGVARPY